MPNAVLLGYDLTQPSFRHRMLSLIEPLRSAGWQVRPERLPSGRYGLRTWERRGLWRWADVIILHQIKLSGMEARLLAAYGRRRIFDVDDAIYVRKPRRLGDAPDESAWRRRKFMSTCRFVDTVAAGNAVLADVARGAADVVILPTSIDTARYPLSAAGAPGAPIIAWIGSPENLIYVEMLRPALARLARRHADMRLRVICSTFPRWDDVPIEAVPWSSETEAASLAGANIGIMPLTDDAWSRGKCAFKLLQYMAAALPCVASPVGANTEAVIDGVNGFHATTPEEWEAALEKLIVSPQRRAEFGAAGRERVQERFAMSRYQHDYVGLLTRLAAR